MQKTHYVYCINKGCDGWSELDFFKDVSLKLQTSCYGKVLMCIYNRWHWENVSGYRCNKLFQAHTSEASHVYHMVDCCLSLLFIHFMPRFGLAIANSDCLPSFQMWLQSSEWSSFKPVFLSVTATLGSQFDWASKLSTHRQTHQMSWNKTLGLSQCLSQMKAFKRPI